MRNPLPAQSATSARRSLPEHPFRPGDLLDRRFRILREVAQGGMGIVYEAFDEKLQRRIALKCAKLAYRGQLPREVRSATEVSHPNVCKIFEIHTASTAVGDLDFMTMEFLEGETLSTRLRRGGMSNREAKEIARQICAGLNEAHRIGLIHGDLKTNNIILTTPETPGAKSAIRAVITDFGLAHRPDAQPGTPFAGEGGGTRGYMSPELLRGEKASVASDIYALGVVLLELASSCKPPAKTRSAFTGETETISLNATTEKNPHPERRPGGFGSDWGGVIWPCLHAEPARRFASAGAVAKAVDRPAKTRRRLLALSGALALAALSALVAYQRAAAPKTSIQLALLPVQVDSALPSAGDRAAGRIAGQVGIAAEEAIAKVRGDQRTRFALWRGQRGATHLLRTSLAFLPAGSGPARYIVDAHVVDAGSGIDLREWKASYSPDEMRFAGAALAGVVTRTFGLPPADTRAVNAQARSDLQAGLAEVPRASGVDQALQLLSRAVSEDPDSAETYAALAEAQWLKYNVTGQRQRIWLEEATRSVQKAELRNPDLAAVLRISGLLHHDAKRYQLAKSDYLRAIQLDPANADAFRRLGSTYERDGQMEEARAAYHHAAKLAPNDYRNHQRLGAFEDSQGNCKEALKHFQDAVRLAPGEPDLHRVLGDEYKSLGRFEEAERALRQSLSIAETPRALQALGVTLLNQGRNFEAIESFQRAATVGAKSSLLLVNLSIAYRLSGQIANSKAAVREGLQFAQADVLQHNDDGYLRSIYAYLLAQNGDRERARFELDQVLQPPLRPTSLGSSTLFFVAFTLEALNMRENTLAVLAVAPLQVLEELNRWPGVAELSRDTRFIQLLATRRNKPERN